MESTSLSFSSLSGISTDNSSKMIKKIKSKKYRSDPLNKKIFEVFSKKISFLIKSHILLKPKISIKYLTSEDIPTISINDYIKRLMDFTEAEDNTIIYALYLIEKIDKKYLVLNKKSVYPFLLSSFIISIKLLEDKRYNNSFYSEVGGENNSIVNNWEYEILKLLDFNIFIEDKEFFNYKKKYFY